MLDGIEAEGRKTHLGVNAIPLPLRCTVRGMCTLFLGVGS